MSSSSLDEESKNCWKTLVTVDIVSSEEEEEEGEEKIFRRIAKRNRPKEIEKFFVELDKIGQQSQKGRFPSHKRVIGDPKPEDIVFTAKQKQSLLKLGIQVA